MGGGPNDKEKMTGWTKGQEEMEEKWNENKLVDYKGSSIIYNNMPFVHNSQKIKWFREDEKKKERRRRKKRKRRRRIRQSRRKNKKITRRNIEYLVEVKKRI